MEAQTLKSMLHDGINNTRVLEDLAKELHECKVSTTQLRKFFGAIRKIEANLENKIIDIVMLEPQLAYAIGKASSKEQKQGLSKLYNSVKDLIQEMAANRQTNPKQVTEMFGRFTSIFECIVAYHTKFEAEKSLIKENHGS